MAIAAAERGMGGRRSAATRQAVVALALALAALCGAAAAAGPAHAQSPPEPPVSEPCYWLGFPQGTICPLSMAVYAVQSLAAGCRDDVDNDGDGLADLDDPGCTSRQDPNERGSTQCDDWIDNDNEGSWYADVAGDPGCTSPLDSSEKATPGSGIQCDDGIDNDGDGRVDYGGGQGLVGAPRELSSDCQGPADRDETGKTVFG